MPSAFLLLVLLAALNLCGLENALASSVVHDEVSLNASCHKSSPSQNEPSQPSHQERRCCHSMIASQIMTFDHESIVRNEEVEFLNYSEILIADPPHEYDKNPTGYRRRSDQILSPRDYFHLTFSIHSPPAYS